MKEVNHKQTLESLLYVGLIFSSITIGAYVYDHKYGKTAETEYKKQCDYRDSCYKAKQDSLYKIEVRK